MGRAPRCGVLPVGGRRHRTRLVLLQLRQCWLLNHSAAMLLAYTVIISCSTCSSGMLSSQS
jgi:hypothetical protein